MRQKQNHMEFSLCIEELIFHPDVQSMSAISKHVNGVSCLDHSIFVSYISFLLCRRFKLDYTAAARGGLLHDLYLCDWITTRIKPWKRLHIHPEMALKNACIFGLSALEEDIILKHMWPISILRMPRYRESAIVSLADKISTIAELLRIYKLFHMDEWLVAFNNQPQLEMSYSI